MSAAFNEKARYMMLLKVATEHACHVELHLIKRPSPNINWKEAVTDSVQNCSYFVQAYLLKKAYS